jgi:1-acyl-sn-glycerol-3-phosphate acyltransferase
MGSRKSVDRDRPWWWWLYQPYKWVVVGPVIVLSTMVFALVAVVMSLALKPRRVSRLSAVPWARTIALVTPMSVEVEGRSNIQPGQSYVLIGNHQSLYDIVLVYGWLGLDFRWVMKQELRKVPGLGVASERLGHIFVDRSSRRAALRTLETARRRIADGASVLFFPEGTRSSDGHMGPFKRGAFRMALDLGVPILPMTIVGTREILPTGSRDLRPGRARLIIHPPIETADWAPERLGELMELARESIAAWLR